jgi:hypothetical protein
MEAWFDSGPFPCPSRPLKLVFRIGWETPGELIGEGARPVFGRPQATAAESANKSCPASKPRYTGIFHIPVERQRIIKTLRNFVRRMTTICNTFDLFSPRLFEVPAPQVGLIGLETQYEAAESRLKILPRQVAAADTRFAAAVLAQDSHPLASIGKGPSVGRALAEAYQGEIQGPLTRSRIGRQSGAPWRLCQFE